MANELVVIEKSTAIEVFKSSDSVEDIIRKVEQEVNSFIPDVSTAKGRKEIASLAYKVAQSKTYLDGLGKDLVAELKEIPKLEAEQKAQQEIEAAAQREREAKEAAERAEREKLEAIQRAEQEAKEAQERAEREKQAAIEAERKKAHEAEQARLAEEEHKRHEDAKRQEDKEHRRVFTLIHER